MGSEAWADDEASGAEAPVPRWALWIGLGAVTVTALVLLSVRARRNAKAAEATR